MFGIFSCYLMWTLWRERNCHIFKDIKNSRAQLIALFSQLLFDWGCAWAASSNSIADFFESSSFCT